MTRGLVAGAWAWFRVSLIGGGSGDADEGEFCCLGQALPVVLASTIGSSAKGIYRSLGALIELVLRQDHRAGLVQLDTVGPGSALRSVQALLRLFVPAMRQPNRTADRRPMRAIRVYGLAALSLSALLLMLPPSGASAQTVGSRRVALVIGNAAYRSLARLRNSGNDAQLIARTLQGLGFTLIGGGALLDLDYVRFRGTVQAFGSEIRQADVALFFYAGHGMQVQGVNWLLPVDANPTRVQDFDFQMVRADSILQQMDGAGTRLNILILDACRNNPFAGRGFRSVDSGLAQMRAPRGTLISYATQPDNVAHDGIGADGPFSLALAEAMQRPGLDIFRMFNQVGLAVERETGGEQQPWLATSPIEGDFYFASVASTTSAPSASVPAPVPGQQVVAALPQPPVLDASGADAALQRGSASFAQRDFTEALRWFRIAASQGHAAARFNVGVIYDNGLGVPRDFVEAARWYHLAADQGYAAAQFNLGALCQAGQGVAQDDVEAMRWYRLAAGQGHLKAQTSIGSLYESGRGVQQNYAEALRWYRLAADQGHATAQFDIGMLYANGRGVSMNTTEALRWLRKAEAGGSEPARDWIRRIGG